MIEDVSGELADGDLSVFLRLGTDIKNNYYEYEVPLRLTPHRKYSTYSSSDQYAVWPAENFMDINLEVFTDLKKERNRAKGEGMDGVSNMQLYTGYDPNHAGNKIGILGNPTLSDVRVVMIGVRNNSNREKSAEVWVNELKVTDFNEDGGWAAKGNLNLGISDVATLNFGGHIETVGFGNVDQSLASRRLDDYKQYNVAAQVDLGRFLP